MSIRNFTKFQRYVGKGGISVQILADSINHFGQRIVTYILKYHRYIHSELKTHRTGSSNSSSTRAVPIQKKIENIINHPAIPIHWGKNQRGMVADTEQDEPVLLNGVYYTPTEAWLYARDMTIEICNSYADTGYHKQCAGRPMEPYEMMLSIYTATEYDNFFFLRCDAAAQPEIRELANLMYQARKDSRPEFLNSDMWHLPFIDQEIYEKTKIEDCIKISAACCAQVSYRNNDTSLEKAIKIYEKLTEGGKVHASPFEHQAKPFISPKWLSIYFPESDDIEPGTTHIDMDRNFWSGNFKGWIQNRQLIPNNVCRYYE